jgi:hypothetical protein
MKNGKVQTGIDERIISKESEAKAIIDTLKRRAAQIESNSVEIVECNTRKQALEKQRAEIARVFGDTKPIHNQITSFEAEIARLIKDNEDQTKWTSAEETLLGGIQADLNILRAEKTDSRYSAVFQRIDKKLEPITPDIEEAWVIADETGTDPYDALRRLTSLTKEELPLLHCVPKLLNGYEARFVGEDRREMRLDEFARFSRSLEDARRRDAERAKRNEEEAEYQERLCRENVPLTEKEIRKKIADSCRAIFNGIEGDRVGVFAPAVSLQTGLLEIKGGTRITQVLRVQGGDNGNQTEERVVEVSHNIGFVTEIIRRAQRNYH